MRTTIDLPDDLHRIASAVARDQGMTLSQAVTALLRRALGTDQRGPQVTTSPSTGRRVVRLGRTITSDDVRRLDDEP